MIPESFVQDLLSRVDIVDVVGQYVQLKKGGANLKGLCPFHNEKTPSFNVSPTQQFYHCFGCGASGNAVGFLMAHVGMSFPDAVKHLASRVGVVVPETPRDPRQAAAARQRQSKAEQLSALLERAQVHYLVEFKQSPQAQDYMAKRGIDVDTLHKFGLAWSGVYRQGLKHVFQNYDDPLLIEAGLVIESDDARKYDRFRSRLMFPIRNSRGVLIGFGGRIIGSGEPKYLNSPETPIFNKGSELYGLWENRSGIHAEGFVLVVEGYMDVVSLSKQGLHNAVATLGTATSAEHIVKLMRASDRIVFSFDGDKAGRRAAWRALQTCLPELKDNISFRFLFLPKEHDPDSYVQTLGPEAFREAVAQSSALSSFLLDELGQRHNLTEAEGRAACLHEARPLLELMPASGIRTQIEKDFARLLSLTYEELQLDLQSYQQSKTKQHLPFAPSIEATFASEPGRLSSAVASVGGKRKSSWSRETNQRAVQPISKKLLSLVLHHPELLDQVTDSQLEILSVNPNYELISQFIVCANVEGARNLGGFLNMVQNDTELYRLVDLLKNDPLMQHQLPDPMAEWLDALITIELENLVAEQTQLTAQGHMSEAQTKRYIILMNRINTLRANRH